MKPVTHGGPGTGCIPQEEIRAGEDGACLACDLSSIGSKHGAWVDGEILPDSRAMRWLFCHSLEFLTEFLRKAYSNLSSLVLKLGFSDIPTSTSSLLPFESPGIT